MTIQQQLAELRNKPVMGELSKGEKTHVLKYYEKYGKLRTLGHFCSLDFATLRGILKEAGKA